MSHAQEGKRREREREREIESDETEELVAAEPKKKKTKKQHIRLVDRSVLKHNDKESDPDVQCHHKERTESMMTMVLVRPMKVSLFCHDECHMTVL